MADGLDRSRFVLDIVDFNLLYKYWLVSDGVFTTDILQNIQKQGRKIWCAGFFSLFDFLSCMPKLRKMKKHLVFKSNDGIHQHNSFLP